MSFCIYKIKGNNITQTNFETFEDAICHDYDMSKLASEFSDDKSLQYHCFSTDESKYHYPMKVILDRHSLGYDVDCIYFSMHSVENDEPLTQYIKVLEQLHSIDNDEDSNIPCYLC